MENEHELSNIAGEVGLNVQRIEFKLEPGEMGAEELLQALRNLQADN